MPIGRGEHRRNANATGGYRPGIPAAPCARKSPSGPRAEPATSPAVPDRSRTEGPCGPAPSLAAVAQSEAAAPESPAFHRDTAAPPAQAPVPARKSCRTLETGLPRGYLRARGFVAHQPEDRARSAERARAMERGSSSIISLPRSLVFASLCRCRKAEPCAASVKLRGSALPEGVKRDGHFEAHDPRAAAAGGIHGGAS